MSLSIGYHTDKHMSKLQNLCRLCGEKLKQNRNYSCTTFQGNIQQVFDLDVSKDITYVHPKKNCGACRLKLKRHDVTKKKMKAYCFVEHSESCFICLSQPAGRKAKKRSVTNDDCEEHTLGVSVPISTSTCPDADSLRIPVPISSSTCTDADSLYIAVPISSSTCTDADSLHIPIPISSSTCTDADSLHIPVPISSSTCTDADSLYIAVPFSSSTCTDADSLRIPVPISSSTCTDADSLHIPVPISSSTCTDADSLHIPVPISSCSSTSADVYIPVPGSSHTATGNNADRLIGKDQHHIAEKIFFNARRKLSDSSSDSCPFNSCATVLNSIPLDRFQEENLAGILKCTVCLAVPKYPVYTPCSHIYCKNCIEAWLHVRNSCPMCRTALEENDLLPLSPQLQALFDILQVKCSFVDKGCKEIHTVRLLDIHEKECKFRVGNVKKQSRTGVYHDKKISLYSATRKYVKQQRLPSILQSVNSFCTSHKENKSDVLFFMLRQCLEDDQDPRSKQIDDIWQRKNSSLSSEQCLALRVDTLQSKENYKTQYYFLKEKGCNTFRPPGEIDKLEKEYLPPSVRYCIESDFFGHGEFYHTPAKPHKGLISGSNIYEPINLTDSIGLPEMPCPNLKGVRYNYGQAIAKTLKEIDPSIVEGLQKNDIDPLDPSILLKTYIKDGADGMGDVSVHWEKSDSKLPDKAFRFAFAVVRVTTILPNGHQLLIFEEEKPNSIRTNRPLLEAIADENHHSSSMFCMLPIEQERAFLKGKILRICTKFGWRRHEISFFTSMINEKFDRSESGLAGSGSSFLCTLCTATRDSAKLNLGSFDITRTYQQTKQIADYIKINQDNLSKAQLDKISLGVKNQPVICSDAIEKGIDSTHADINMASFFKKVIVREIGGVTAWELRADVKDLIVNAESRFDRHMRQTTGITPALMMPGNYARTLFDEKNVSAVTDLILSEERKLLVCQLLHLFRFLRKIYRAKSPLTDYPAEVKQYKAIAVQFGKILLDHFSYVHWPNYLHKVIEHVQELIEHESGQGSIGMFSGEGNEGGNKVFRYFRKNLSRKGDVIGGLKDVLQLHWLYSSKKLQQISMVTHKQNRCSVCFEMGHKRTTCPNSNL